MDYNLHGLSELIAGVSIFGVLALLGWYFTTHKDISDDSRTFR
ncbi:MAG: hypothetical protein AB7J19_18970 [Beijerinckiaceae bacterium]